jgi:hypothetical protein
VPPRDHQPQAFRHTKGEPTRRAGANRRHRQILHSRRRHQSFHPRRSLVLRRRTISSSEVSLARSGPMGGAGAALRLLSLVRWNGSLKQRTLCLDRSRPAISATAKACEADRHHRPSGGLRDRAADGKIEAEAAASVCNEIVTAGQIDGGTGGRAELEVDHGR